MSLFRTGKGAIVDPVTGKALNLDYADNGRAMFPIHLEHPHWRFFNTHLHRLTGDNTTLAAAATKGDYTITVVDGTSFASGKMFIDGASAREVDSIKIMSQASNVITMAKPLSNSYPIGTNIRKVSLNMAVNGSVTPVSFEMTAPPGLPVHIETINWYINTPEQPYDKLFGGGPGLARGMHMRTVEQNGAIHNERGTFRINQRFRVFDYQIEKIDQAAGPQADWALWAKINLREQNDGIIRLDPSTNDKLEVLVQDDLTNASNYTEVECAVGGHFEL